jgi:putative flippase GtrA
VAGRGHRPPSGRARAAARARHLASPEAGTVGQGVRFAIAGGTVALVYLTTTTVLAEVLGVPFQAALAAGFAVGLCVHFTLQRAFVWRDHDAFVLALHHQLARYLVLAGTQYGVTAVSTAVLPGVLGVSAEIVYLATVFGVTVANFLIFRSRVFHSHTAAADGWRVRDGGGP